MGRRGLWWAGATALALVFAIFFINVPHTRAENERVITIYHDGVEQTVVTDATTVKDVLARVNVSLQKYDNVEPAVDTTLVAPSYNINVYRARPVTIVDGPSRYDVMTASTSSEEIIRSAKLALYPEDTTAMERINDFVAEGSVGLKLVIHRATPINLVLYGKQLSVRTQSQTVGDLLKEKNVVLGSQDGTNTPLNTAITANMTLTVWRNGVQTVAQDEDVPFSTRQIKDVDRPLGYKSVQTAGVLGKRSVTYEINTQDGREISRTEIQSVITAQPQEQVEVVGVKPPVNLSVSKAELMTAVGIPESDWAYVDYIITRESGWCATKWQGEWGVCPAYHGAPTSGGYGLCQSTPPGKMAAAGPDWQYNPITQLTWCNNYALKKYKSWAAAYNYWVAHHNW